MVATCMDELTIITLPSPLLLTVSVPTVATGDSVTMAVDVIVLFITVKLLFAVVAIGVIMLDGTVFMLDDVILTFDEFDATCVKVTDTAMCVATKLVHVNAWILENGFKPHI